MLMHPQADGVAQIVVEEKSPRSPPAQATWKIRFHVESRRYQGDSGGGCCRAGTAFGAAGIDAVIAEGTENGGHGGEMTTMALVPQVVDAVGVPD